MSSIDRSGPPAPAPLRSFDFPPVTRERLSNGLPLDIATLPRLPLVTAMLVLRAGEDRLGEAQGGLAVLTGDALEGGTEELDGLAFAEALESIGADLSVSTGWDVTTVGLSCLADRLEEGLRLLAAVVRAPAFPEEEVARTQAAQLARIHQLQMDPGGLAGFWTSRTLYAAGEPYARSSLGSAASVESFNRDAVRGFADRYLRPAGGALILSGDVDPAEVQAMAEEVLGDWTGGPGIADPPSGRAASEAPRVIVVNRPGAVQSELRIGHPGAPRDIPDRAALTVGSAVLGGTFSSRLNLNLREKHGFTYGVRARWSWRRGPGPFSISTAVDTGVTADAVREALAETRGIVQSGPTQEEVEQVRDFLAGVFPLQFESTSQVASRIGTQRVFGLPEDEWDSYRDRIRAVEAGSAHDALRRYIHPDRFQVVVVGDAEAVAPQLEALDIGPVEVVEP